MKGNVSPAKRLKLRGISVECSFLFPTPYAGILHAKQSVLRINVIAVILALFWCLFDLFAHAPGYWNARYNREYMITNRLAYLYTF